MSHLAKPHKPQTSLVRQLKRCLLIVASLIASIFIFSIPVDLVTSSVHQHFDLQQLAIQQDLGNLQLSVFNKSIDLRRYITTNNATFLVSFQNDQRGYLLAVQDLKNQVQGGDFRTTVMALAQVEQQVNAWDRAYVQLEIASMQA